MLLIDAEHDGFFGGIGRDARQRERVADMIGDVLDGGDLIVVGQQGRAAQVGEPSLPLVSFLQAAFDAARLRGASLLVEPPDWALVRYLERNGLVR